LGAAFLVLIGAVFGGLFVMSFNGVGETFGFSGKRVMLGGPAPISRANLNLLATQQAFVEVAKDVTPAVVSVTVISTPKSNSPDLPFFHNFQFRLPTEPEGFTDPVKTHYEKTTEDSPYQNQESRT
ncbi:MAG: hypothetical protein M1339_05530, partial [Bacteroidetes bacterium]|nr:hypothetical protein [Bacteroidota bacterium]